MTVCKRKDSGTQPGRDGGAHRAAKARVNKPAEYNFFNDRGGNYSANNFEDAGLLPSSE